MFLKQEKPEMDKKKTLVLKEKYKFQYFKEIFLKISTFFMDTLGKM